MHSVTKILNIKVITLLSVLYFVGSILIGCNGFHAVEPRHGGRIGPQKPRIASSIPGRGGDHPMGPRAPGPRTATKDDPEVNGLVDSGRQNGLLMDDAHLNKESSEVIVGTTFVQNDEADASVIRIQTILKIDGGIFEIQAQSRLLVSKVGVPELAKITRLAELNDQQIILKMNAIKAEGLEAQKRAATTISSKVDPKGAAATADANVMEETAEATMDLNKARIIEISSDEKSNHPETGEMIVNGKAYKVQVVMGLRATERVVDVHIQVSQANTVLAAAVWATLKDVNGTTRLTINTLGCGQQSTYEALAKLARTEMFRDACALQPEQQSAQTTSSSAQTSASTPETVVETPAPAVTADKTPALWEQETYLGPLQPNHPSIIPEAPSYSGPLQD